jgi:hypothetical protein
MRTLLSLAAAACLCASSAFAHHSFAAQYDAKDRFTIKGTVTKIDWINPHSYIYLDVKDESGKVSSWSLEGYPPNTLVRTGVKRAMVKVGDEITVEGCKARDGSHVGAAREVTFKDGTKVFWGPSGQ